MNGLRKREKLSLFNFLGLRKPFIHRFLFYLRTQNARKNIGCNVIHCDPSSSAPFLASPGLHMPRSNSTDKTFQN